MRVMVTISETGELLAYTHGYRGQPADVVVPPFVTAVTAALQRLNARPHAPQLVSAVADTVAAVDELPAELDDELVEIAEQLPDYARGEFVEVGRAALGPRPGPRPYVADVDEHVEPWRLEVAEDLIAAGAAAVVTSGVALVAVPEPAAAAIAPPIAAAAPSRPARRRPPARRAAPPPPPPGPMATAEQVDQLEQHRATALQMLDDGELPEVIADQLGVSVRQVRAWDRGDR